MSFGWWYTRHAARGAGHLARRPHASGGTWLLAIYIVGMITLAGVSPWLALGVGVPVGAFAVAVWVQYRKEQRKDQDHDT